MKVSIIAAITIDGKIAKSINHFPEWTGNADKKMFARITKKAGIMIMGSKTYDLIGKALSKRLTIVMTRNKLRISKQKNLIFTDDSAEQILQKLKTLGYRNILVCGGAQINQLFINKKLIDELIITYSPFAFGKGIHLFPNNVDLKLKLKSATLIDNDSICVIYKIA